MTDLEATRLCAEAIGWKFVPASNYSGGWRSDHYTLNGDIVEWDHRYKPLHDDAQAMALVKKFRLELNGELQLTHDDDPLWVCCGPTGERLSEDEDLNRAIVYCVATMQAGK